MTRVRRSLGEPPEDLRGFPTRSLTPARRLWRIHRLDREAWWFSSDGEGPFDLSPSRGTCYVAENPLGSLVEVFHEITLVSERDVGVRRLSELHVPGRVLLADCTDARARGFGCTGEIHTTVDYELTQRWARTFADGGFDGIRYLVRHDPAQRQVGIALFGEAGSPKTLEATTTARIPDRLLALASRHFGIHALPRP